MRFLTLSLLLLFFKPGYGQLNLVPNPSFEDFDTCPDNEGQISRAIGWQNYGVYNSTPDYFNACDTGIWNVPNGLGVKQSAKTGSAFAAVVTYYFSNYYREYIGIELFQPLTIGTKYFLSFYTTLGELLALDCPTNNIGIKLSTIPFSSGNPLSCTNSAQLKSDSIISDTLSWTYIKGSFVADSVYNYLIIGNFYDNLNTDTLNWRQTSYVGYYAIDDVCLATDSIVCSPLTVLNKLELMDFVFFPNPTNSTIHLEFSNYSRRKIEIFNSEGKLVSSVVETDGTELDFPISALSSGFYFLSVTDEINQIKINKKIIKF